MKFKVGEMEVKVGDKFRLTREGIKKYLKSNWRINDKLLFWAVVDELDDIKKVEDCFELVPEEPEFEYGEEIEVSHEGGIRVKRIFICKSPCSKFPYLCVYGDGSDKFKKWDRFSVWWWRHARKLRPQLTRKEIAEKFWVSEDFTLVD